MNTKKISLLTLLILLGIILPSAIFGAPGDLDLTFGQGGVVRTSFGNYTDQGRAVAIQSDGKIVVAGVTYINSFQPTVFPAIARYNPDGTLDLSFANGGKTFHRLGGAYESVIIQPDGKILVAGNGDISGNRDFLVRRYNANGSLDNTFGSEGVVSTGFGNGTGDYIQSVLLQPDGKIVAVGASDNGGSESSFALARYNSDGSLDASFDGDGKLTTTVLEYSYGRAGVLQPDGKIVVAGYARTNSANLGFALARYNSNGSLDTSFGTAGKFVVNVGRRNSYALAVALEASGKIVAAGANDAGNDQRDFALVRCNPNGSLDEFFGAKGIVQTDVDAVNNESSAVIIQPNGKIIIGGTSSSGTQVQSTLVRYNSDGVLDNAFGQNGIAKVSGGFFYSGTLQPDGKIIFVGSSITPNRAFYVVRFLGDTPLNPSFEFDNDGKPDYSPVLTVEKQISK